MSARSILTLASRRGIDLRHPTVELYADRFCIAEHLAKVNRFNGATAGTTLAVAEHTSRAADFAFSETKDPMVAGAVLIHDDPEFALGDDTTPKKNAIAEEIAESCGVLSDKIIDCWKAIEERHAMCAHLAAGLPWPLPYGLKQAVKHFDKVAFVTEWRDLMGDQPHPDWAPYDNIVPIRHPMGAPRRWHQARLMYLERCQRFLPVYAKRRHDSILDLFPELRNGAPPRVTGEQREQLGTSVGRQ